MTEHKTMTLDELCTAALVHGSLTPAGYSDDKSTWIVAPCGRHRESDLVAESNHDVAIARLAAIDPDENDHAVVRSGHFAVGWIDEIIVRPGSACAVEADAIRESLEGYPILSDDHHSMLELEASDQSWREWQERDTREAVTKVLQNRCTAACLASDDEECSCNRLDRFDEIEAMVDAIDDDTFYQYARDVSPEECEGHMYLKARQYEAIADKIEASLVAK